MKTYKHIIFTAIALSLVALFAANQVIAHGESSDFAAGKEAGYVQALNDSTSSICYISKGDVDNEVKKSSEMHTAKLMNDNSSDDFIKGFQASYESNRLTRINVNCGT
jgi:hypothetical protein